MRTCLLLLLVLPFGLFAQTKIIDPPFAYEFISLSSTDADFKWSPSPGLATTGTADGYLAFYRFNTPVDAVPTNGVSYAFGDNLGLSTAFQSLNQTSLGVSYPTNAVVYWKIYAYSSVSGIRTYSSTGLQVVTRPPSYPSEPSNSAANISFSSITSSGFSYSYTPASGADGHFIICHEGSAPSYVPVDGSPLNTLFTDGSTSLGTVGSNSGSVSNAKAGTTYYFKIYPFNYYTITDGYMNYKTTSVASGSVTTLPATSSQPNNQPTSLSFSSVTASGFNYAFSSAIDPPDGYLGLMRKGASPTAVPADNTVFTQSQALGDATVDFLGTSTSGSKTGLAAGQYFYDVFSYNNAAIRVTYYNNRVMGQSSFSNLTVDNLRYIDFDWGTGSPKAGVNADNFSARFTFKIYAPVSGTYTFHTTSDDGVILRVNNTEVINKWLAQASTAYSGTISLTAGQAYDVELLYVELTGGAVLKLEWTPPGQTKSLVRSAYEESVNYLTSSPLQNSVCVNPPKPTITTNNGNPEAPVLISSSTSGNQWYLNGTAISGSTGNTHTVSASGVYTVKVSVDGCMSEFSSGSNYVITGDLPLEQTAGLNLIVYPNPAAQAITVNWVTSSPITKKIELYDLLGRRVHEANMDTDEISINVSSFQTGQYLLRGSQGNVIVNRWFLKN